MRAAAALLTPVLAVTPVSAEDVQSPYEVTRNLSPGISFEKARATLLAAGLVPNADDETGTERCGGLPAICLQFPEVDFCQRSGSSGWYCEFRYYQPGHRADIILKIDLIAEGVFTYRAWEAEHWDGT